jgi:Domain of unknown function (DUF1707)/Cell wall-active antibiotics response 4TMS YvqF
MSGLPAVPDNGNLRASDADRERVANIVREAAGDGRLTMEELDERLDAVYAAKTYAELEPITKDLPAAGSTPVQAPAPVPPGDLHRFGGEPTSSHAFAVLGGFERSGDWVVPKNFSAVAVLGGGEIDLRQARFAEPAVTINVVAILGGIEIIVPEDATVHVSGIGILGGFEHGTSGEGKQGGPQISITGVAILGGVEVRRRPPRKARRSEELAGGRDFRHEMLDARRELMRERRDYRRERHEARRAHMRGRRDYRRGELD